ncbi:MAG: hypothetical protein N3B21_10610 [Clostridia bacterium]|nr:hypothetical protein [Clostridia bacterium]
MNNHCRKGRLHSIIMILCCAAPLLVLAIMYFTKLRGTETGSLLSFAAILICPLSHLVLIPLLMGRRQKNNNEGSSDCH